MSRQSERWSKIKVLLAMSIAVLLCAVGDVLLGYGVRSQAEKCNTLSCTFVLSLGDLFIWGGILLLLGFFALYLISLSWGELSFVLPLTAAEYILVTIFACIFLDEHILELRWAGSVLVALGIVLVTRS